MFSDRLDVDVFHQPAEGAGLITPGLVADGGEDLVDGGLFEVGHVLEGRNDFVCGHDSDPWAVFVDGDVTLEEIANDDGVRIDGLLLGPVDVLHAFADSVQLFFSTHVPIDLNCFVRCRC